MLQSALTNFPLVLEELRSLCDDSEDACWAVTRSLRTRETAPNIPRVRRTIRSIFDEYGEYYLRRAYRMDEPTFWKLHSLIEQDLVGPIRTQPGGTPNGAIATELKLSVALRYLAGGDPLDIMISHGISHSAVYESIWLVVDAINHCDELKIRFPSTEEEQQRTALGFRNRSTAKFSNCVGAIDGMLVWITKPNITTMEETKIGAGKFYCGRKKKYGLSLQAVCDSNRRFLDIYVGHPASASDLLVFTQSPLRKSLEDESKPLLFPQFVIYGDAAYVNNNYMVSPFRNAQSKTDEDDFNYYQSQVRICIECAFGMLTQRWAILRKPMPAILGIRKTTAIVGCVCRLHNYCIDSQQKLEPLIRRDRAKIATGSHILEDLEEDSIPRDLLGGGNHFDDISRYARQQLEVDATPDRRTPREQLVDQMIELDLHRPSTSNFNKH